jgi:hypothetical protein
LSHIVSAGSRFVGRRGRTLAGGLVVAFVAAAWLNVMPPASAAPLCEPFAKVEAGDYVVQNNRWGSSSPQCIEATADGFTLTQQEGTASTSGPPLAYPSIIAGCHYGVCGTGEVLPAAISQLTSLRSTVSVTYAPGVYNASYDIWLDPESNPNRVNATEIMIWLNRQGAIQPIGSPAGSKLLAGQTWQVWTGSNGQNDVVSYVAPGPMPGFNGDLMEFVKDTVARGKGEEYWSVNSVQFGFEPWENGVGLAASGFSVNTG